MSDKPLLLNWDLGKQGPITQEMIDEGWYIIPSQWLDARNPNYVILAHDPEKAKKKGIFKRIFG